MLELGRSDEAWAWAERGTESTHGWQVAKLFDIAAGVLVERGDESAVLDLRREQHLRISSATTYTLLQQAARSIGAWELELAEACSVLAEPLDRSGISRSMPPPSGQREVACRA